MKTTASFTIVFAILATASAQFNPASFPPVNEVPPITSPQVVEWLKEIKLDDVPKLALHPGNPPAPCPPKETIPADTCWWTCQGCAGEDIESCPNPLDWGLTFDDGPTNNTIPLLQTLKTQGLKATFFVMGSNVVRNADALKQEVADGHHIASHTWSHHPLTSLSNEQIVAEMKWTEKAVFDITGLKMKYMRPPYGDIDNRVRSILKKLGYVVVDWTSDAYDSKDFSLNAKWDNNTLTAAVTTMTNTLNTYAAAPGPKGVITLEHDLYPVTIQFAQRLLANVDKTKLKIKSVAECVGDANPYQNGGNNNSSTDPSKKPSGPSVINGGNSNGVSKTMSLMIATVGFIGAAINAF